MTERQMVEDWGVRGLDDGGEEAYIPLAPRRRRSSLDEIMDKRRRESELRATELQKLTCPRRGAR
ncbi:hypothetical protein [Rhodococcus qingshengii]|uniref:hypothetical protein n=1 Tax=Rhodococcus qingshengii TaxID=334542 RepID=UPI003017C974